MLCDHIIEACLADTDIERVWFKHNISSAQINEIKWSLDLND